MGMQKRQFLPSSERINLRNSGWQKISSHTKIWLHQLSRHSTHLLLQLRSQLHSTERAPTHPAETRAIAEVEASPGLPPRSHSSHKAVPQTYKASVPVHTGVYGEIASSAFGHQGCAIVNSCNPDLDFSLQK